MYEIPEHILIKLTCDKCDSYLRFSPVMINQENYQICGVCFRDLQINEQESFVKQLAFETIAQTLTFPCKYKNKGCEQSFPFNFITDHENNCPNQNKFILQEGSSDTFLTHQTENIAMTVQCGNIHNALQEPDSFKLNLQIEDRNQTNSPYLSHAISTEEQLKLPNDYMYIQKKPQEDHYEKISCFYSRLYCASCNLNITEEEMYQCVSGHCFCKTCLKENKCTLCGESRKANIFKQCKNYFKGCLELIPLPDLVKHQIDCEFNDFECPLCDFLGPIGKLNQHFREMHKPINSNQLETEIDMENDRVWFLAVHDRIFSCKLYNFGDSIEILVVYFGKNDAAKNFKYKVKFLKNGVYVIKTAECIGWNDVSLAEGISFEIRHNRKQFIEITII